MFEELGELFGCERAHGGPRRHARGRRRRSWPPWPRAGATTAPWTMAASAAATSRAGSARSRRSRSAPTPRAARGRSWACSSPACGPTRPGLYLMDMIPDGPVRWGYPNINDTTEVVEMIACGAHAILFSTGCGSVVGSAIAPVVKVCANPETYRRMAGDMDVDAGRILEGRGTLDEVGRGDRGRGRGGGRAASPPSPRRWATRSSCSATSISNRSGRPASPARGAADEPTRGSYRDVWTVSPSAAGRLAPAPPCSRAPSRRRPPTR